MKGNQIDNEHIATPGGHLEERREKIKERKREDYSLQTLYIMKYIVLECKIFDESALSSIACSIVLPQVAHMG